MEFRKELTSSDFVGLEFNKKECSTVLFYSPMCGHCIALKDNWNQFSNLISFQGVYTFNCMTNQLNDELRKVVKGFPTILYFDNGKFVREYNGDRTVKSLIMQTLQCCPNIKVKN